MTLRVKTRVAVSSIHGLGLFAAEPIAKGAVVWQHDPWLDGWVEPRDLSSIDQIHVDHFMCWDESRQAWIRAMDNVNWMNHSSHPNLNTPNKYIHIASRDIDEGEELTVNYQDICDLEENQNDR